MSGSGRREKRYDRAFPTKIVVSMHPAAATKWRDACGYGSVMHIKNRWFLFALLVLVAARQMDAAQLSLNRHFSDHMVLQQGKPTVLRGTASAGQAVSVAFAGQHHETQADADGLWTVTLLPMPAHAKGLSLSVTTERETITLDDILIGDVFLVALQTSVDISLGASPEGIAAAREHRPHTLFRTMSIQTLPAVDPLRDLPSASTEGWQVVRADNALSMSATAYYVGKSLTTETDVPIGIIDLNMGSAFPISWLNRDALLETQQLYGNSTVNRMLRRFDNLLSLQEQGEPFPDNEVVTEDTLLSYAIFPAGGYNAVLHPLRGLGLKAALVQLGNNYPHMIYTELQRAGSQFDREELNRAYVQTYDIRKDGWRMTGITTPRVPREWRRTFGDNTLPIGLILPPSSDLGTLADHHRELRELHRVTAKESSDVALILPGMDHQPFSAQPRDAELIAQRSMSWLRGTVFANPDVVPSGPLFDRIEAHYNEATIYFKAGTATGLTASDEALRYFEAADVDGVYSPVEAVIAGETIRIRSDVVNRIVHVRYNWNRRPNAELVNAAGLPAFPFRSQNAEFRWFIRHADDDLPMEYFTPANEWPESEVALISGHLKTHGYPNFTGWVGPAGIHTGPFGPNMGVRDIREGSPADGKIFVGDMIYSANGNMLGDRAWEVMAAAVTESETRRANGKLVLGVRRGGRNIDVELTLPVMGSFSATSPYDCPKTERIVSNLEQWLMDNGPDAGFLNTDALFMLATGNPELQGFVRRAVYHAMSRIDLDQPIDPTRERWSWHNSADAFLFGEYYLATGDRAVLPYLKNILERLVATMQPGGGWRHRFPGGPSYGFIPNAGIPGVMGMHFANIAGLDIDMEAFETALAHFHDDQAETGFMIYGIGVRRPVPAPFDPAKLADGQLDTFNGGLSAAGILMRMTGHQRAAHLSSLISAFAWNTTYGGHGGNFWNNFWTPLGAFDHGREAFIHFWQNHRWYREMNRRHDGAMIQDDGRRYGAGTGIALVAPRRRLQIVGAPASPFAANALESLQPALDAYRAREYARAAELVDALLDEGTIGVSDRGTVEALGRIAREMDASITADLARMEGWARAGDPATARTFIRQLQAVMHPDDARLAAVKAIIDEARQGVPEVEQTVAADDTAEMLTATEMAAAAKAAEAETAEQVVEDVERDWVVLTTEVKPPRSRSDGPGQVSEEEASRWRIKEVEHLSSAPENWTQPDFDDADWGQTSLPISWRMYHTVLLRTSFHVEDKEAFDRLRFRAWLFRQQGIEIYLNGYLIGRINNLDGKTGNVDGNFLDSAVQYLRNGENTLAITTRHNWRWGMLFMNVYNDGFGFRLDARKTL